MRLPAARWFVSLPASMFYCMAASAMLDTLVSPRGVHASLDVLAQLFLPGSIALWVLEDARRRGQSLHYDAGSFVFFAWPVLVPIYLFSTRGWRAFAAIGWFLLLYVAAVLFGSVPYFIFSMNQ